MKVKIERLERKTLEQFCQENDLEVIVKENIIWNTTVLYVSLKLKDSAFFSYAHYETCTNNFNEAIYQFINYLNKNVGQEFKLKNKSIYTPYITGAGNIFEDKGGETGEI